MSFALGAKRAAEDYPRKEVSRCHTYARGSCGKLAFNLMDVRPPPQEINRQAGCDLCRERRKFT
jgi:hypothetical protein